MVQAHTYQVSEVEDPKEGAVANVLLLGPTTVLRPCRRVDVG